MSQVMDFLLRTRGKQRLSVSDMLMYGYLLIGTLLMFGPVLWAVSSSFKTPAAISRFPPELLPYAEQTVTVAGHAQPLPLYAVEMEDGTAATLAQVRRIGREAQMIDPNSPDEIIRVPVERAEPLRTLSLQWRNYVDPLQQFQFFTFFGNSVIVTASATILTLLTSSMAAFALSKYQFRGQKVVFGLILLAIVIPGTVNLVPAFLIITALGLNNSLLGVIIPTIATPTGVFLLRQYMLTIPDELIDAARVDGAPEWRVYWQVVLPLAAPALAVLTVFSIMWRWNDFLWPLIVLTETNKFTLQLGLQLYQGRFDIQWQYLLAMTVLSLLPVTFIFAFLQRFITQGIASTGLK
jgi:alpha-1,4-digalacturonate transport system permease protein